MKLVYSLLVLVLVLVFLLFVFYIYVFMGDKMSCDQIIPRKVLFGNPDHRSVSVSPNGEQLSYLAPRNGVMNIWVANPKELNKAIPITNDKKRGIRYYSWAYSNNHILYIQDKEGDENWQLYSINLIDNKIKKLTSFDKSQVRIVKASEKFPFEILISINKRRPEYHDVYRLNIETGEMSLIYENDEFISIIADNDFKLRFGIKELSDASSEIYQLYPDKKLFTTISMEDNISTGIIGFNKTNDILYMTDSRGRNTSELVAIDLNTNEKIKLGSDEQADISDLLIHPAKKNIQAFASTYKRKSWKILDDKLEADIKYLNSVDDGEMEITSRSLNDKAWIVAYLKDNAPISYYYYDRDLKETSFLFTSRDELRKLNLTKMHSVVIKSRDGLDLVSYLSLPLSIELKSDYVPKTPLPLILIVHGGPWVRDVWGYDALHQWLTNRGYAVLSVNYRSSTGLGKNFVNAGNGQWAGKMHDDLIDAVNWAIDKGIALKDKIGIIGGSYGGYATLVGLTFTPDVFACGVDIVGPSSLVTLINSVPPYWKPVLSSMKTRIGGDPDTEQGKAFLEKISPLFYVDNISKPLLIAQGANDPRVKQAESDQIVNKMKDKDIPVTYVLYPDEGHGFARPQNKLAFYAIVEPFLAKCLGGKVEPTGKDFEGSSIQFKVNDAITGIPSLK